MRERREHERRAYARNEMVFEQGSVGSEMYVITSGKIRIFRRQDGKETTLSTLKAGDFFGEMAIFEQAPRSASAQAAEDAELQVYTREQARALVPDDFVWDMIVKMSGRIRQVDEALERLNVEQLERLENISSFSALRTDPFV